MAEDGVTMDELKFVNFDVWCPSCKHYQEEETEEPCNTCLTVPAREYSHKPEKWEENKK